MSTSKKNTITNYQRNSSANKSREDTSKYTRDKKVNDLVGYVSPFSLTKM